MRIQRFEEYSLNEGWLGDKLSTISNNAKQAVIGFTEPFVDLFKNIKGSWKNEVKSEDVIKTVNDLLKKSFDSLDKQIDKVETPEELQSLYNDMSLAIAKLKEDLTTQIKSEVEVKESLLFENLNLRVAGAGLSAIMDKISDLFNTSKEDFTKTIDDAEELQKKKAEAKKLFKTLQNDIRTEIDKLKVKDIMDAERAGGQTPGEFKPGDEVTYVKQDGDEQNAQIASSQKDVEEGYVRLTTEQNPKGFVVSNDQIKDSKEKDSEDVTSLKDKLSSIKGDKDKIEKVSDFVNSLE